LYLFLYSFKRYHLSSKDEYYLFDSTCYEYGAFLNNSFSEPIMEAKVFVN